MTTIYLSLEVQNGFEQPKQRELLTHELAELAEKLEETTDWTEEEQFISHAFEGDYTGVDEPRARTFYAETLAELSLDYPDLVFSLNVFEDADHKKLIRRDYFWEGSRQTAYPEVVVADYSADGDWDVIVDPEGVTEAE